MGREEENYISIYFIKLCHLLVMVPNNWGILYMLEAEL